MRQLPRPPPADPFRAFSTTAARRYDAWYHSPAGRAMAEEEVGALAAMLPTLPAADSILEVGCGTGHFTRWLATQSGVVLGVDPSPGMVAVARDAGGASGYLLAAAEALPFADGSVDVAAFITTLEFLQEPTLALAEAARVARAGILLGVLNLASPLGVRRRLSAWFGTNIYSSARFYTVWNLQRLVRRALPGRVEDLRWTTALWPAGTPQVIRRLPCGAFIAMAVQFEDGRKEQSHACGDRTSKSLSAAPGASWPSDHGSGRPLS